MFPCGEGRQAAVYTKVLHHINWIEVLTSRGRKSLNPTNPQRMERSILWQLAKTHSARCKKQFPDVWCARCVPIAMLATCWTDGSRMTCSYAVHDVSSRRLVYVAHQNVLVLCCALVGLAGGLFLPSSSPSPSPSPPPLSLSAPPPAGSTEREAEGGREGGGGGEEGQEGHLGQEESAGEQGDVLLRQRRRRRSGGT